MTWHRITRLLTLIFVASLMAPALAPAQIIQIDPLRGIEVPPSPEGDNDQRLLTASERRGRDTRPSAMVGPSMERRLVPLRASLPQADEPLIFRLSGEVVSADFILILPNTPSDTELLISSRSGIDLLPASSSLRILINGTFVGELVPDNFSGFAEDKIAVPDGIWRAGRNLVEIEARHTHRIACGPKASFDLWTEISAGMSGATVASSAFKADNLGFLSAIAAQTAFGQAIEIRRPDPNASLADAAPFIGMVANALGGMPPAIVSSSYWPLVGSKPALARITVLPADEMSSGPRYEHGGDGAIVLILEHDSDFSKISKTLTAEINSGLETSIRALTPGVARSLADLQPSNLIGEGHYIFLDVPFQLPWDWLLLSSQKARLDLDYSFAGGLPDGSLMLVKVNGNTVRLLPLDSGEGSDVPTLRISFEARLLQPGANQLAFEVLVPGDPVDRACQAPAAPFVEIADSSQIFVPSSPSMEFPSIDRSLADLSLNRIRMTEAAEGLLSPGFVPQIAAALAIHREPGLISGMAGQLHIGTVADLEALQSNRFDEELSALALSLIAGKLGNPEGSPKGRGTGWNVYSPTEDTETGPTAGLAGLPRRISSEIRRFAFGSGQTLETWIGNRTAHAAILQLDVDRPGDLWLILGRQAVPEEIARSLASSHLAVGGPSGQVAVFADSHEWESWKAPDLPLRLKGTLSFATFRDVMGNYATHRPFGFLAAIFAFTILSAMTALTMLRVTRRKR